ncbi:hypothetical protein P9112_001484 [Eukaryota sp. TZLM1-RC]
MLLVILKPLTVLVPEVPEPTTKVPLRQRVLWTALILLFFLIASQVPLYGMLSTKGGDPFYWSRVILASNKGTLMELGISPIITSGMVLQLLSAVRILRINQNDPNERALHGKVQKLIALGITLFQAIAYTLSGIYGPVSELGMFNASLIVLQLLLSGVVVILWDDMLSKNYCVTTQGVSLFIASNICEQIVWTALSPITAPSQAIPGSTEFEGALLQFVGNAIKKGPHASRLSAIRYALFRRGMPNVTTLVNTAALFYLVLYLSNFRVEIPLKRAGYREGMISYPIKLFYTANMPAILQNALISNLFFVSQLLFRRFGAGNGVVRSLGIWDQGVPIGGLVSYLASPRGLSQALANPMKTLVHSIVTIAACAGFSFVWLQMSGSGPVELAQSLKQQRLMTPGTRQARDPTKTQQQKGGVYDEFTYRTVSRYVKRCALVGGALLGCLVIAGELLGCVGGGTGVLMASSLIANIRENIEKEQQKVE